jgi:hypothetical protein
MPNEVGPNVAHVARGTALQLGQRNSFCVRKITANIATISRMNTEKVANSCGPVISFAGVLARYQNVTPQIATMNSQKRVARQVADRRFCHSSRICLSVRVPCARSYNYRALSTFRSPSLARNMTVCSWPVPTGLSVTTKRPFAILDGSRGFCIRSARRASVWTCCPRSPVQPTRCSALRFGPCPPADLIVPLQALSSAGAPQLQA